MAFNAGSIEATLTLDRSAFTAGLKAARAEANAWAKNDIEVQIVPKLKDGALAAIKARIEKVTGNIDVGLSLKNSELAAIRARLARVAGKIDVSLNLKAGELQALRARLRNLNADVKIRVDGVARALADLTAIELIVNRLDGRTVNIQVDVDIAGALAAIATLQAALATLRGTLGSVGGSIGGGGAGVGGFAGLVRIVPILLAMIAIAPALAAAGAAITVAWGAIATAVAAIPPVILGLGALIGPVMLGMDGISKAAGVLSGNMTTLKASVSAAFEKGLIPAFNTLKAIFPTLTTGSVAVADAISLVARDMATFLTQTDRMGQISKIFDNVATAVKNVSPGLKDIVGALIDVAAQTTLFEGLTKVVNNFGAAFKQSVTDRINDGTLQAATSGLTDTLDLLSRGLVGLVDGGIKVFAGAAPGFNAALDSIGSFFTKFDWERLGTAAGAVFQGIADGIAKIPVGTVKEIENAFVKLGDSFKSQAFTQGLADIASVLPDIISGMANMTEAFGEFMSIAADVIAITGRVNTAFGELDQASKDAAQSINDSFGDSNDNFEAAAVGFEDMMDEFERSLGIIPPIGEEVKGLYDQIQKLPPDTVLNVSMTNAAATELQKLGVEVVRLADGSWNIKMGANADGARAVIASVFDSVNNTIAKMQVQAETAMLENQVAQAEALINNKKAMMKIDGDEALVLAKGAAAAAQLQAQRIVMSIFGEDKGAVATGASIAAAIGGMQPIMGINAADRGAQGAAAGIAAGIAGMNPAMGVNAADRGAMGAAGAIAGAISGLVGTEGINAADRGARAAAAAVQGAINGMQGVMSITARDAGALATARGIAASISGLSATIRVTTVYSSVNAGVAIGRAGSGGGVIPHFGDGGVLPGYAPGRDVLPALLSPGESILVPELTRMFGKDTILSLNKMASHGRRPMMFGTGGTVPLNSTGSSGSVFSTHQSGSTVDNRNPDVVRKLDQVIEVLERIGMKAFVSKNTDGTVDSSSEQARRTLLNLRLSPR